MAKHALLFSLLGNDLISYLMVYKDYFCNLTIHLLVTYYRRPCLHREQPGNQPPGRFDDVDVAPVMMGGSCG